MHENPNPVFGYRADFRVTAKRSQRVLMLTGLVLLLGILPGWIFDHLAMGAGLSAVGLLFFLAGILWSYYWRGVLRAQFQQNHGPQP